MNKTLKRFMTLVLVITMTTTMTMGVYATVRKTVQPCRLTTVFTTANKAAPYLSKGTTVVTFTGGYGFVKFKAPATKEYSFTVSGVKGAKGKNNTSFAETYVAIPSRTTWTGFKTDPYLKAVKTKTRGGSSYTLKLTANGKRESGTGTSRYLKSRTGTYKLRKGQVMFIYVSNLGDGKTTATIVIK